MDVKPKQRRRHSTQFKEQVLAACAEPGASVAAVALSFGLNDNLVHQWRRGRGTGTVRSTAPREVAEPAAEFIALPLPATPSGAVQPPTAAAPILDDISLEFKRGAVLVSVRWPMSAAAECAAWLREVLR